MIALVLDVLGLAALIASAALLHIALALAVLGVALLVLSWRYAPSAEGEVAE